MVNVGVSICLNGLDVNKNEVCSKAQAALDAKFGAGKKWRMTVGTGVVRNGDACEDKLSLDVSEDTLTASEQANVITVLSSVLAEYGK